MATPQVIYFSPNFPIILPHFSITVSVPPPSGLGLRRQPLPLVRGPDADVGVPRSRAGQRGDAPLPGGAPRAKCCAGDGARRGDDVRPLPGRRDGGAGDQTRQPSGCVSHR
jgi:hypothetical protein